MDNKGSQLSLDFTCGSQCENDSFEKNYKNEPLIKSFSIVKVSFHNIVDIQKHKAERDASDRRWRLNKIADLASHIK